MSGRNGARGVAGSSCQPAELESGWAVIIHSSSQGTFGIPPDVPLFGESDYAQLGSCGRVIGVHNHVKLVRLCTGNGHSFYFAAKHAATLFPQNSVPHRSWVLDQSESRSLYATVPYCIGRVFRRRGEYCALPRNAGIGEGEPYSMELAKLVLHHVAQPGYSAGFWFVEILPERGPIQVRRGINRPESISGCAIPSIEEPDYSLSENRSFDVELTSGKCSPCPQFGVKARRIPQLRGVSPDIHHGYPVSSWS